VATIPLIAKHRAGAELKRAYASADKLWGFAGNPPVAMQILQCFCHRPAYVEDIARGYFYIGWAASLPRATLELVAVLVSKENECFY
jgi:hypothetical protein